MADQTVSKPKRRPWLPRDLAHRIEAVGAGLMFGFFRLLPVDAASAVGGWLGRLVGPRLGVTKRAQINLQRALPHLGAAEARLVMRGMWDNLGRVIAEYPHLEEFKVYGDDGRIEFVGDDILDPVIASGKSAIFISAHYGNWEIATMAATQRGLDVAEVYRAANNPWIDLLAIMTAVNAEIESWIRARPEMWLWLHRRWPD